MTLIKSTLARLSIKTKPQNHAHTRPEEDSDFFPIKTTRAGYVFYHGTSLWFSQAIEMEGFVAARKFLDTSELIILQKYAHQGNHELALCLSLVTGRSASCFARSSKLAYQYASHPLRGGNYFNIYNTLTQAIQAGEIPASNLDVINVIKKLEPLSLLGGVVYALEFTDEDLKHFARSPDTVDAYIDVPEDRIVARMEVPF